MISLLQSDGPSLLGNGVLAVVVHNRLVINGQNRAIVRPCCKLVQTIHVNTYKTVIYYPKSRIIFLQQQWIEAPGHATVDHSSIFKLGSAGKCTLQQLEF